MQIREGGVMATGEKMQIEEGCGVQPSINTLQKTLALLTNHTKKI